jgi:hypothetical protein
MRRGIELQFRTRSRVITTEQGQALAVEFKLGPVSVFVIANMPEYAGDEAPLCYVKLTLGSNDEWSVFKDYSKP